MHHFLIRTPNGREEYASGKTSLVNDKVPFSYRDGFVYEGEMPELGASIPVEVIDVKIDPGYADEDFWTEARIEAMFTGS